MVFSSNIFLFLFFPAAITGYFVLPKFLKNFFLLVISLFFYAWGEPRFVFVMAASILFNYLFALLIAKTHSRPALPRVLLFIAVAGNLGLLGIFKYLNFFLQNINRLGLNLPLANIALPIGISFFTFQALSYVVDVYRGTVAANPRPQDIGLYISFFPQLIAGPIVRYQTIEREIHGRKTTLDDISEGFRRFVLGLGKKVLLANNMALVADAAFASPAALSVSFAWMGALAYAFQIYYDFSGYSDMAIGLGRIFGFHFLENFNYPYISRSISEFWRRWHMSLGQWFRDYVYFPLSGSRVKSGARLVFNLLVVWLLTGLWHGASWNFVLWGILFFIFIMFEKLAGFPRRARGRLPAVAYQVLSMLVVLAGWVLFRSPNISATGVYLGAMLGAGSAGFADAQTLLFLREHGVVFLAAGLFSTPFMPALKNLAQRKSAGVYRVGQVLVPLVYFVIFIVVVSFLVMGAHNPFIYFNF